MTSALPEGSLDLSGLSPNETMIHFSRAGTIFAAVSASIFTAVGIAGKTYTHLLINFSGSSLNDVMYTYFSPNVTLF